MKRLSQSFKLLMITILFVGMTLAMVGAANAVTGLSATTGDALYFTTDVPAGVPELVFDMYGGYGDADIYVKYGVAPTVNDWDYRPYWGGNDETVTIASPAAGKWHVMIHAYTPFYDVAVQCYARTISTHDDLSDRGGGSLYFTTDVPAGVPELVFEMGGGYGDADIYVKYGAEPTVNDWDYRPYCWGNDETVTIASPAAGVWHVMIHAYSAFDDVMLKAFYFINLRRPPKVWNLVRTLDDLEALPITHEALESYSDSGVINYEVVEYDGIAELDPVIVVVSEEAGPHDDNFHPTRVGLHFHKALVARDHGELLDNFSRLFDFMDSIDGEPNTDPGSCFGNPDPFDKEHLNNIGNPFIDGPFGEKFPIDIEEMDSYLRALEDPLEDLLNQPGNHIPNSGVMTGDDNKQNNAKLAEKYHKKADEGKKEGNKDKEDYYRTLARVFEVKAMGGEMDIVVDRASGIVTVKFPGPDLYINTNEEKVNWGDNDEICEDEYGGGIYGNPSAPVDEWMLDRILGNTVSNRGPDYVVNDYDGPLMGAGDDPRVKELAKKLFMLAMMREAYNGRIKEFEIITLPPKPFSP